MVHPPQGMIPPDRFIALAEADRPDLRDRRLRAEEACIQVTRWRTELPGCGDLTVRSTSAHANSSNPTGRSRRDALLESGLPADALWLEITESVMMSDTLETLASLTGLRGLGVHLSVDDFGTGYSSLSYLQRYPVEQVKIDKSFVAEMETSATSAALVKAVVDLAHNLGVATVAEGVENADQKAKIQDLGCTYGQGYLFARPLYRLRDRGEARRRSPVGESPSSRAADVDVIESITDLGKVVHQIGALHSDLGSAGHGPDPLDGDLGRRLRRVDADDGARA